MHLAELKMADHDLGENQFVHLSQLCFIYELRKLLVMFNSIFLTEHMKYRMHENHGL